MRKNKQYKISFLDFNQRPTYKFSKVKVCRLVDGFREYAERSLTPSFVKNHLKQFETPLFEFKVQDKYKAWTIVKRLQQFLQLKQDLGIRYSEQLLPIPIQSVEKIDDRQLNLILNFFELFLNHMSNTQAVIQNCFTRFVGSIVSHQMKQAKIYYQGKCKKKAGGRHNEGSLQRFFNYLSPWDERLVSITPQGIYLTEVDNIEIQDHLIFSTTFSFLYGQAATGSEYGIVINSSQRVLNLDAQNVYTLFLFVRFLNQALNESQMSIANRYGSFAKVKPGCDAKYYIDGQNYFNDLCQALLAAKQEIFITGWMISPFFSLRRPDYKNQYRLDTILGNVANAGIKVNIIIYYAPKVALNIDSQFTQNYLTKLSSNIKVILHPHYVLIPFMWTHHQKMVVIDQKIGFMGGLDLGYGRFDNPKHLLTDPESQMWPGVDYCNYRMTDILNPQQYTQCSINRKTDPRMPWHDIAVKLMGGAVQDLARHFIQYWNYVNLQEDMDDRELLMYVGIDQDEIEVEKQIEQNKKGLSRNRQGIRLTHTNDSQEQQKFSFLNFFKKEKDKTINSAALELPFQMEPEEPAIKHKSTNITIEDDSKESQKQKEFYKSHLQEMSKFKSFVNKLNPKNLISNRLGTSFDEITLTQNRQYSYLNLMKNDRKRKQKHQILRSASMWSLGLEADKTQQSILNAYVELIQNAKQFIYIQNQFFMSQYNGISTVLAKRILRAYSNKQKFRVVIFLPALPGFDGHPANQSAAVFRIQVHLILKTVNEMYDLLLEKIPNTAALRQYLYLFSLRAHAQMDSKPVTEIIYIHSKMMIIDDTIALIGSANINDRSLKGTRDTELAVVIQDEQTIIIETSLGKREVGVFAHQLRKDLYMQHFSLTQKQAEDYFDDDTWDRSIQIAKKNHEVCRQIFGCYPDNEMSTFQEMELKQKDSDLTRYDILKIVIKSNAIPFQRHFLRDQDLTLKPNQKEYFVPDINFA